MRSTKDLLLYLFFFGMLGFASLAYYFFTNQAVLTGGKSSVQVNGSAQQGLSVNTSNVNRGNALSVDGAPVNPGPANEGDTTGYRRPSDIMGINTADIKEDTSAVQFVDLFKSSIPFAETAPWGSGKDVVYDKNGWPKDLKGGQALTKFLNRLPANTVPDGFYTVLYDGKGTIHYGNDVSLVAHRQGMDIVEIKAGNDGILNASLAIRETDPKDYIRNIRVLLPGGICRGNPYLRVDDETECAKGQYLSFAEHHESIRYNPDYLNFIKDFKVIRFMNMSGMTRNPVQKWEDRHHMEEATWGGREGTYSRGAPVEIMVDIANRVNADPWFSMPYQADDDYVRNFAKLVKENLKPELKAYIEYSNEIWNPIFIHHDYAIKQGLKLKLSTNKNKAREHFHSYRSVQVFDIWEEEFGGTDRLVRVMGAWTSNPRMSNSILSYRDAYKKTDALAIAPYFGATIKEIQRAKNVDDIFEAINNKRSKKGFAASVRQMQQQAKVAEAFDVDLIAYEGGQHLVDWNTRKADDGNNELLYAANRDRRMGELYKKYLKEWEKAGGKLFVQFSAPRIYSWYGSWGIKEYISQPRSEAPKYDAILSYMEEKAGIESPKAQTLAMNTATARKGVSLKRLTSPDEIWTLDDFWPVYSFNSDPSKRSEISAKWQATWDDRNFYLNISVRDRNVESGDGVEVIVQVGNVRNRLKIMYGERHRKGTLFAEMENGYRITSVLPWKKLAEKAPEAGESIGFDIAIFDVDDKHEKKDIFWAERVEEKAGDRKVVAAALDKASKLGHKEKEIVNNIPQVILVIE
ncbi:MAG: hypothetical protein CSB47_08325 [Proteobacteria bacterium]|nr:MAG: hypothetical protein CSB47_08325 [Pseudomonadota bacterium]